MIDPLIKGFFKTFTISNLVFLAVLFSCSSPQVILSKIDENNLKKSYPRVPTAQVIIYRTKKPLDLENYEELGTIILTGDGPRIDYIYSKIRAGAGKHGAHFVVDVKLTATWETRTQWVQQMDGTGKAYIVPRNTQVIAYTAAGTLLRRKE